MSRERSDVLVKQGYSDGPCKQGPLYVRRAKNEDLEYELELGSIRDRAGGGGYHNGKPIFGHDGPEERDKVAKIIGKQTKAKKKAVAQKRATQ